MSMAQTGTSLQGVPLLFVARGTAQEICDPLLFWMCVLPKHTRNTMSCCSTPLSIGRVAATSFQALGIISWHTSTQGDSIFDHASASTLLKSLLRFMAHDTLMNYCSTFDVRGTYGYCCDTISTVTKQQLTGSQTRTALLST
jgi:hypothetical protein